MVALNTSRSVEIDRSIDQVRETLLDLRAWPKWSPWLIFEPSTKIEYFEENGKTTNYTWDGVLVGAGRISISSVSDEQVVLKFDAFRPWKSTSSTTFDLESLGEQKTRVTWSLDSNLPFFMFMKKAMFEGMIGSDYERGLKMLKEYLETASVSSRIEILGVGSTDAQRYFGIRRTSSMAEIPDIMTKDFAQVTAILAENNITLAGPFFSIYERMDFRSGVCTYISAAPIGPDVQDIANPHEGIIGSVPAIKAIKVKHTGAFDHLPNAWSAAGNYMFNNKHKPSKSNPSLEIYLTDPDETSPEDIETIVCMAVV